MVLVFMHIRRRDDSRFATEGLAAGGRAQVYGATVGLIADYPWFGTGIGTFVWSFPAYRPGDIFFLGRMGPNP